MSDDSKEEEIENYIEKVKIYDDMSEWHRLMADDKGWFLTVEERSAMYREHFIDFMVMHHHDFKL